nr:hypothetical protein [Chloroflexota bacterium]
ARGRVRGVARMGVQLARRRLSRRPAVLILDDENGEARGAATRLAGLLLRMLARRTTQEAWLSSVAGELR